MTMLPYAKTVMTLSLVVFLGAAVLTLTGTIGLQAQHLAQAVSMTTFGVAFGAVAAIMRTWLWRTGVVVATCQTLFGIGSLLWLSGAFA